jgi:hypothetical protein
MANLLAQVIVAVINKIVENRLAIPTNLIGNLVYLVSAVGLVHVE